MACHFFLDSAEVVDSGMNLTDHKPDKDSVDVTSNAVGSLPCGFVVGIVNRNWRDYVCVYVSDSEKKPAGETAWIIVTPWDRRIPRIRVHTTQSSKLATERYSL